MKQDRLRATPRRRVSMIFLGLLIGSSIYVIQTIAIGSVDYLLSNFGDESGPLLFNVLLASTPFLMLAVRGTTERLPWLVGLALMLIVWGYVIFTVVTGGLEEGTSVGNAMWLAMVLIGSTVVITITCYIISRRTAHRSRIKE